MFKNSSWSVISLLQTVDVELTNIYVQELFLFEIIGSFEYYVVLMVNKSNKKTINKHLTLTTAVWSDIFLQ